MNKIVYNPQLRTCKCCGEAKPLSEFYLQSYTGEFTAQCKTCINVKRSVVRNKQRHNKFVSKEKQRTSETVEFPLADWKAIMLHFGGLCAYCGKPEGRSKKDKHDRDHIIPLSRGGKTERHNIICACAKCNRSRGNKEWFDWYIKQPFYSADKAARIQAWIDKRSD